MLSLILLRLLLSQAMGGAVSKITNLRYYVMVYTLLAAIFVLKITSSIELIIQRDYAHIFREAPGKTLLIIWLEVQITSIVI